MPHIRFIFSLLMLPSLSWASGSTGKSGAESFINSMAGSGYRVEMEARGHLNQDNLEDWAIIFKKEREGYPPLIKIVALMQQPHGTYTISISTPDHEFHEGGGGTWIDEFTIKRSSIFITIHGKTCCAHYISDYQFKMHKSAWRLVGAKHTSIEISEEDDEKTIVEDTNYLTGLQITTSVVNGAKNEKKLRRKVGQYFLKDFNFSGIFGA